MRTLVVLVMDRLGDEKVKGRGGEGNEDRWRWIEEAGDRLL